MTAPLPNLGTPRAPASEPRNAETILMLWAPRLRGVAARAGRSGVVEVEDLEQVARIAFCRKLADCTGLPEHIAVYRSTLAARGAVYSMVKKALKPCRHAPTVSMDAPIAAEQSTPLVELLPAPTAPGLPEHAATLPAALATLSPKHRDLIARHYFGGESLSDIAEARNYTPQNASLLHRQALAKLRRYFSTTDSHR